MKLLSTLRLALLGLTASVSALAADRFVAQVTGQGAPVLLIPGLNCSGEVWNATVKHLRAKHECHVLTLAGFAGVPGHPGEFSAPTREAIADYIRAKKLNHPAVIGHSLGGFIAADLAATHPELVGPIVVVDSYPFLSGVGMPTMTVELAKQRADAMKQQMDAVPDEAYRDGLRSGQFTRTMMTSEEDNQKVTAWGLASDRHTASTAMNELLSTDLRGKLANIESPVLVMLSAASLALYIPADQVDAIGRAQYGFVRKLSLTVHPTARHFLMFDDPDWFHSQVDTFIAVQP